MSAHTKYTAAHCESCGARFQAAVYRPPRGVTRFCSIKCAQSRRRPRANVYPSVSVGAVSSKRIHVLVAERALGHPLPTGAHVHHVNGNKHDNVPKNLVMCQDAKYHALLHVRAGVFKKGGNPNTQRWCGYCVSLKKTTEFSWNRGRDTFASACRACVRERTRPGKRQWKRQQRVKKKEQGHACGY